MSTIVEILTIEAMWMGPRQAKGQGPNYFVNGEPHLFHGLRMN
jgi:hypothetical protein